jgi:hypothetical protein
VGAFTHVGESDKDKCNIPATENNIEANNPSQSDVILLDIVINVMS